MDKLGRCLFHLATTLGKASSVFLLQTQPKKKLPNGTEVDTGSVHLGDGPPHYLQNGPTQPETAFVLVPYERVSNSESLFRYFTNNDCLTRASPNPCSQDTCGLVRKNTIIEVTIKYTENQDKASRRGVGQES